MAKKNKDSFISKLSAKDQKKLEKVTCSLCNGSGMRGARQCPMCDGDGELMALP